MKRLASAFAALSIVATAPVHAREWPDAGGWEIFEDGDEACTMAAEYPGNGDTIFSVQLDINGGVFVLLTNTGWSAKKNEEYTLSYAMNGFIWRDKPSFGVERDYSRKGFGTFFKSDFIDDLAKGSGFKVTRGEVIVDSLDLEGSAAGVAQLRRCVANVKRVATAAAAEKARFAHIKKDPFANNPGKPLSPGAATQPARARANLASYVSNDDYPAIAQNNREEGTVHYDLDIGPNGRVTNCTITKSSGSSSLDSTTCRLMLSRARFTPATDASGSPTADKINGKLDWKLAN